MLCGFEHRPDPFLEALLRSLHCLAVYPSGGVLGTAAPKADAPGAPAKVDGVKAGKAKDAAVPNL
jgi:hypothetical protein